MDNPPLKSIYQIVMDLLMDRAAKRIRNREPCRHLLRAMLELELHRMEEPIDAFDEVNPQ